MSVRVAIGENLIKLSISQLNFKNEALLKSDYQWMVNRTVSKDEFMGLYHAAKNNGNYEADHIRAENGSVIMYDDNSELRVELPSVFDEVMRHKFPNCVYITPVKYEMLDKPKNNAYCTLS